MNRKVAFVLVILAAFSIMVVGVVYAQPGPPPLPSSFWGTVRVNGQNVPTDTVISAWISETQYAYRTVMTYPGWGTVYALDVSGDQAGTPAKEGGVAGDTITFKIGTLTADQSAKWRSGTNTRIDLTATRLAPATAVTLESFIAKPKLCLWGICDGLSRYLR